MKGWRIKKGPKVCLVHPSPLRRKTGSALTMSHYYTAETAVDAAISIPLTISDSDVSDHKFERNGYHYGLAYFSIPWLYSVTIHNPKCDWPRNG